MRLCVDGERGLADGRSTPNCGDEERRHGDDRNGDHERRQRLERDDSGQHEQRQLGREAGREDQPRAPDDPPDPQAPTVREKPHPDCPERRIQGPAEHDARIRRHDERDGR